MLAQAPLGLLPSRRRQQQREQQAAYVAACVAAGVHEGSKPVTLSVEAVSPGVETPWGAAGSMATWLGGETMGGGT